jgi:hypothetical protein
MIGYALSIHRKIQYGDSIRQSIYQCLFFIPIVITQLALHLLREFLSVFGLFTSIVRKQKMSNREHTLRSISIAREYLSEFILFIKSSARKILLYFLLLCIVFVIPWKEILKPSEYQQINNGVEEVEKNIESARDLLYMTNGKLNIIDNHIEQQRKHSQLFSVSPTESSLPKTVEELENKRLLLIELKDFMNSTVNSLEQFIVENKGQKSFLSGSKKMLLELKQELETKCKKTLPNENNDCHLISGKISRLLDKCDTSIISASKTLNLIEELKRKNHVPKESLLIWQQSISKLSAKLKPKISDQEIILSIQDTDKLIQQLSFSIRDFKQTNVFLDSLIDEKLLKEKLAIVSATYSQLQASFSEQEKMSKIARGYELVSHFGNITEKGNSIKDLQLKVKEMIKSPSIVSGEIRNGRNTLDKLGRIARTAIDKNEKLLTAIDSSLKNRHFNDIKNQRDVIEKLQSKLTILERELENSSDEIIKKETQYQSKFGELSSLTDVLHGLNRKLLKDLGDQLRLVLSVVICAVLFFLFILYNTVRLYIETRKNRELAELNPDELLIKITSSKERMFVKIDAIKLISKKQLFSDAKGINTIKEAVRSLETSSINSDIKVAAELRLLLDSLELRFSERRGLEMIP